MRFLRPGRETLHATFRVAPDELVAIRAEVAASNRAERRYTIELTTAGGELCATVEKVISVRKRETPAAAG